MSRPRIGGTWKGPKSLGGMQRRYRKIASPPRSRAAQKLNNPRPAPCSSPS